MLRATVHNPSGDFAPHTLRLPATGYRLLQYSVFIGLSSHA